jgi:hypothetical protein
MKLISLVLLKKYTELKIKRYFMKARAIAVKSTIYFNRVETAAGFLLVRR